MDYPRVKDMIYVNGCDDEVFLKKVDSDYLSLRDNLRNKLDRCKVYYSSLKKKDALRITKLILSSFFDLRSVWHLDRKGMDEYILKHEEEIDAYYEAYKKYVSDISPYDVKVLFKKYQLDNVYIAGEVKSRLYYLIDKNGSVPKVSIDSITLSSKVTNLSIPTYTHELFHTRLQSVRGSVKYFENLELLSYFGGLLVSLKIDDGFTLEGYEVSLLQEVVSLVSELEFIWKDKNMDYDEFFITAEYLYSIIKAFKLFYIYYDGNEKVRNELVKKVQSILDGDKTLEDILDSYDIDECLDRSLLLRLSK